MRKQGGQPHKVALFVGMKIFDQTVDANVKEPPIGRRSSQWFETRYGAGSTDRLFETLSGPGLTFKEIGRSFGIGHKAISNHFVHNPALQQRYETGYDRATHRRFYKTIEKEPFSNPDTPIGCVTQQAQQHGLSIAYVIAERPAGRSVLRRDCLVLHGHVCKIQYVSTLRTDPGRQGLACANIRRSTDVYAYYIIVIAIPHLAKRCIIIPAAILAQTYAQAETIILYLPIREKHPRYQAAARWRKTEWMRYENGWEQLAT